LYPSTDIKPKHYIFQSEYEFNFFQFQSRRRWCSRETVGTRVLAQVRRRNAIALSSFLFFEQCATSDRGSQARFVKITLIIFEIFYLGLGEKKEKINVIVNFSKVSAFKTLPSLAYLPII
ncbi:hypothetical protein V1478_017193, partial [Vespula squamosa]